MAKLKTGTREWSEHSLNWQKGCSNGCLYCYGRQIALRFKRIKTAEEWTTEVKTKPPKLVKREGVIMAPTQHDITPFNIGLSIETLLANAHAGNRLLIVSKPRIDCVIWLCQALRDFKQTVEFRFTIGCLDDGIRKLWEPGAPNIEERFMALGHASRDGFKTSISCEPLLEPWNAQKLVIRLRRYTDGDIWLGCMNDMKARVGWKSGNTEVDRQYYEIKSWQDRGSIEHIWDSVKGIKGIRAKDSYKKALGLKESLYE